MLSPLNPDCWVDETSLPTGPDATMQGLFIHLTIGGDSSEADDEDQVCDAGAAALLPQKRPDWRLSDR